MTENESVKETMDELQDIAKKEAEEIEGKIPLHLAMGISNERVVHLEKTTRDLCRLAPTVADCLRAISTCGNFDDFEKVFCTHQWTKGLIAHKQKKAFGTFAGIFRK